MIRKKKNALTVNRKECYRGFSSFNKAFQATGNIITPRTLA